MGEVEERRILGAVLGGGVVVETPDDQQSVPGNEGVDLTADLQLCGIVRLGGQERLCVCVALPDDGRKAHRDDGAPYPHRARDTRDEATIEKSPERLSRQGGTDGHERKLVVHQ